MLDEVEFLRFFEDSSGPLRRYLLRITGSDRPLTEDIMQEAYLRFLTSTGRRLEPEEARRYLFRIAGNLLRDHWRKNRRTRPWASAEVEQIPHAEPEDSRSVDSILATLPASQKTLLWLAYVEGFDHREIGNILGLSRKSIRVLLFRARKKMAELLRGDEQ